MEIKEVTASQLSDMFLAGAKYLESKKDYINELNVFPVPDGDTGTNMTMTIMSAAREVAALESPDMKSLSKAISSGSLRGARGNSGVILSQLFRGFTKVIKTEEVLTVPVINDAFQKAVETAYKAVMKPKEGTILTVARAAADKASEIAETTDDIVVFCQSILQEAEETLAKTPDMLPVLKQAGVVDSGGQGLVEVLRGGTDFILGKEIDISLSAEDESGSIASSDKKTEDEYIYKVSFVLLAKEAFAAKLDVDLLEYFDTIGSGVHINTGNKQMQISLSTNEPGRALTRSLKFGMITDVSIDNTTVGTTPVAEAAPVAEAPTNEPPKDMGFVTVSIGEGMNRIFRELGADYVIEGGQTMNPSTEDILSAIGKVNANTVFVLPNNKNIVLAANQAKTLCENKEVIVLPTKTLPQGITALINYIPDQSPADNESRMIEEIGRIASGEITHAVRDTTIDDKEIREGDYMGIGDKGILSVCENIEDTFIGLLGELVTDESSLVSIYYGSDVSSDEAAAMSQKVTEEFPDLEVELQDGGQPVYYYVISVE